MPLVVEVKLTGVEKLTKSQINRALKAANFGTGVYFRRNMLPDRFTVKGGRRLGYTRRSGETDIGYVRNGSGRNKHTYAARKERHIGHNRPLELTGQGKREALATPQKVRVTRDKIVIPLPRKYNLRNPKSKVRMGDEIRKVTPREAKQLEKRLTELIEINLNKVAGVRHKRRVESATITNL